MLNSGQEKRPYTEKQGQYLAFIHLYIKLNGVAPSHADFQMHFKVTPPTVNQMIKILETKGFIHKKPGVARSIKLLIPVNLLPELG